MKKGWDSYFFEIAKAVATRGTCNRLYVGALLVQDRRIIATGYNGAPSGLEECNDVGHLIVDGHCVRSIHAEANAIIQAALHGVSTNGAHAYLTAEPCWNCAGLLINAGIKKVSYLARYNSSSQNLSGPDRLREAGIDCIHHQGLL